MPNSDVTTTEAPKKTTALPAFFTATPKMEVLHQAVVSYLANARQSNAHTKTRGEISGGGRKPWKQKGTGRARAGSSRSPLWIGGGITFGPRSDANHTKRLPVKLRRLALSMALSVKVTDKKLIIVPTVAIAEAKTKQAAALIAKHAPEAKSVMIVVPALDAVLMQAMRNLPTAAVTTVNDLNTYDVLNFDTIIMTEDAVKKTEEVFGQKAKA
jgi:large subunit ribosomal protein L4